MNAEQLLAHYERIADAPDAIAHLRRFVLDLAVRGKLVEQKASEGSALNLVENIMREKASRGVKEKTLMANRGCDKQDFFSLPRTWTWVPATFPTISISDQGKKIQTKDVLDDGPYPVVDQGKVAIRGYCADTTKVIRVSSPLILFGDHTRETKFIDFDFVVGADGVKLLLPIEIDPKYYLLTLRWLPLESRGYGRHFKMLRESQIPLPPLAEQHRIVAKVDELMALCDQLEEARKEREAARDRLTAASLARLNTPDPDPATFTSHARFALDNLSQLSKNYRQIPKLRATIIELATRGKLTYENANDTPPSEALESVQKMRDTLVRDKLLRREKPLPSIRADEIPFQAPSSWLWARLGDITLFTQYGTSLKAENSTTGVPVLTMGNIQNGAVISAKEKRIPVESAELPELYLKKFDLLYNRTNSPELVGKTGIYLGCDDTVTFASYLIRLRLIADHTNPHFINYAMNTPSFRTFQIAPHIKQQTGQANVNGTAMKNMLIALPPIEEQRRIVAKVDELMALCDRLETSLAAGDETRQRLLEAVLHEALEPAKGQTLESA